MKTKTRLLSAAALLSTLSVAVRAPAWAEDAAGSPAPDLKTVMEEYRALTVGQTYDASGRSFTIGHLELNFRSGSLTAVQTPSGRETGFVFEGEGHYTYTSEDRGDLQSIEHNLSKNANAAAYRNGALSDEMKGCAFVATSSLLAEALGPEAKPLGAAPASAASRLGSLNAPYSAALDHSAALAAFAGQPGRILFGRIDGQTVDPEYFYDPLVQHEEQLFVTRTVQGDHFDIVVSRQPIGDRWTKSPFVLTNLDYTLETANNKDATVTVAETFAVNGGAGRILPLSLINNNDQSTISWTSTRRGLEVVSVKGADGRDLPFSHRYHQLLVALPESPAPGSTVVVSFDLKLHFLDTPSGDQYTIIRGGAAFPEPLWENSVKATSHWKITTKKPYRAFTGGTTVARREEGDSNVLESKIDAPSILPLMIAGKFETKESEKNGLTVRASIYGSSVKAAGSYIDNALILLDVYGKALVPYPRKEIEILEFPFHGYYQSPAGLVICSTTYATAGSVVESLKKDTHLRVFMHELAHQWYGNLVTPRRFSEDNWISEALAEYLGAQVYAAGAKDPKEKAQKLEEAVKIWRRDADMSKDSVSIAQAWNLAGGWTDVVEYEQLTYSKGALVVRMLHSMLGEDRFWQLMTNIVKKYANKDISTEDFANETSAVAGQDMAWFFKQWIQEPGIPDLDVSKSIVQEGGKTYLTGHLKQKNAVLFKRLWLPFVFEAGGGRGVKLVVMDKPEMDFKVEIPAGVSSVVLDPAKNNLVYYH